MQHPIQGHHGQGCRGAYKGAPYKGAVPMGRGTMGHATQGHHGQEKRFPMGTCRKKQGCGKGRIQGPDTKYGVLAAG